MQGVSLLALPASKRKSLHRRHFPINLILALHQSSPLFQE
jgi:hypothetical protein